MTTENTNKNNDELVTLFTQQQALSGVDMQLRRIPLAYICSEVGMDTFDELCVVRKNRYACWDRFGFVCGVIDGSGKLIKDELDQVGYVDAYAYLLNV